MGRCLWTFIPIASFLCPCHGVMMTWNTENRKREVVETKNDKTCILYVSLSGKYVRTETAILSSYKWRTKETPWNNGD